MVEELLSVPRRHGGMPGLSGRYNDFECYVSFIELLSFNCAVVNLDVNGMDGVGGA